MTNGKFKESEPVLPRSLEEGDYASENMHQLFM